MVKSKDEIMQALKTRFGEDTSDDTISIIEDISDTLDDYSSKITDKTDWKAKYDSLDADWRKRYTERFYNPVETKGDTIADVVDKADGDYIEEDLKETFDDLFKEGE